MIHSAMIVTLLLISAVQSAPSFSGSWQRDNGRGGSFFSGEYPEMTLDIDAGADTVRIRQALGSVKDGVTQAGSGEKFLEYELTLDGETRDVLAPSPLTRRGTATAIDGGMKVVWNVHFPEGLEVTLTELWTLIDGGTALQIQRTAEFPELGTRQNTVVFSRRN